MFAPCTSSPDPLPIVCTSPARKISVGAATIPHQVLVAKWKTNGQQSNLLSASGQYGLWNARPDEPCLRLAFLGRYLTKETDWKHEAVSAFSNLALNPSAESRRKPRGKVLFFQNAIRPFVSCFGLVAFLGLIKSCTGT